jgi:transcription-repair coupling factor (superfamily II helicase)
MANEGQPVNLSLLLALLQEVPVYRRLVKELSTAEGEHRATVLDAARPYVIAALYKDLNVPIMVVTAQPESARKLHEQLRVWCPPSADLHRLPELDFLPYDSSPVSPFSYQMLERLRALTTLALHRPYASCHSEGVPAKSGRPKNLLDSSIREESEHPSLALRVTQPPLIVASALAIMSKTIPHEDFIAACHVLELGMAADPLELLRRWQTMGYEVEDVVEVPGQMSKRGGIVDVFTPFSELPVRIEFFGNRIESMRCFDPESQRSSGPISSLILTPARELMPTAENSRLAILNSDSCTLEVKERFEADLVRLQERQWFPGAEFYFPLFNTGSVFDYLGSNALLILDEPEGIELVVTRLNGETQELRATKMERGELPQGFPSPYLAWEELESQMEVRHRLTMDTWNAAQGYAQALPFVRSQSYGGQLERFLTTARKLVEQGQRVLVVSHQANRLAELLQKEDIHTSPASEIEQVPPPGSITVLQGSLDGGWLMADGLTLITDTELFGFVKQPRAGKKKRIPRRWFLPQLVPGDYVVHVDHGIARFNGLTRMFSHGIEGEYLVLEYAAGDRLYVPIERIDRISRYIGAGDQAPPLSRLRSREWQRTKRRVKESVAEIAHELLDLYASREIAPGFAFSPDSLWQQELEASFPYMETPDQVEAIMTVKEDMEGAKPTDRLICGDVGYGKTEIALRAAFKAVMDNKQVAILVPTTILAQQHLITFTERLQTFPLRVEMLSRFCPPEKEGEIIAGLANGTVEVDTLALSATPIPRTLHMSLSGIRDMSIVETPPEERLSIKTYVGVYDATLVRQVILREVERNGQVFFVHNRVQSIGLAAGKLQDLVPEVRIAIAHGQMHEEQLEKVMADFVSGKYDVLLTTTIIQLGLDMPNVNTLIVNQADKFGLGQLYQLRGRVGRGINQAYAYFLFDEGKLLTPQAHKRLRTIFEAAELGSGFGIAMKDLEIRGAGNLLGVKQSGHIAALGFDLYCQLLAEAVEESKASSPNISPEGRGTGEGGIKRSVVAGQQNQSPSISLPLAAYIPEEYVPNLGTRLGLYHRLAGLELIEEVADFVQEFIDRFGALPQPVDNLLYMVKIKVLAIKAGVSSVSRQGRQIVIRPRTDGGRLTVNSAIDAAVKTGATQIRLDTRLAGDRWQDILEEILRSNCG